MRVVSKIAKPNFKLKVTNTPNKKQAKCWGEVMRKEMSESMDNPFCAHYNQNAQLTKRGV